jgi:hypothetical protein
MGSFTGRWKVNEVHIQKGDGSHTPQKDSEIRIVEGESGYALTFKKGATPILIPRDADPDHLHLDLPAGVEGYGLDLDCWSLGAAAGLMTGRIRYGSSGNEDNDTATFTATIIRPEERP